ncbi:hypothetical protein K1T71_007816 [Dendrolimus kikuchii]|uniref:Uncharacterized protein n=1 Tax=Dendrolimus kikuchii TaxID=765133 RepID=A0ACC1CZC7_9NEOP|nr:hypothetical protein K1T71_007816 [Dendrolimus kikuchii]
MRSSSVSDIYKKFTQQSLVLHRFRNGRNFSTQSEHPKPYKSIPGLNSLPVIGTLHHFLPLVGEVGMKANMFEMFIVLHKKYGPIVKMEGLFSRADMVLLFEPEHFEQVYKAEEAHPWRPGFESLEYYRENLRRSTFDGVYGLTTAQGAKWREFRTKVNPAMLKPKLVKLYAPGLDEIAKEMVDRLTRLKDQGDYLKQYYDKEVTRWSLESVAFVGLGTRLGSLNDGLPEDHPSNILIKCSKDIMDLTFKLELLPRFLKFFTKSTFMKLMDVLDLQWEISTRYINEVRKSINERENEMLEEDKSIIEKLLAIDEKVAVMMANEMLLAGIDTVAFTTTNLLYHLSINPNVQDKLREEIRSGETSRYLKACLKEALRMWHVIPGNLRRASKEHIVGGYVIPRGVDVIAPNEYLSRLEKYYPQPNKFIPERWLVDKTDPLYHGRAHPMVTLPFGFGVRSCIGRRIAELEIEILFKRLINELKVSWEGPPLKVVSKLMNSFAKPFYFKFEKAE